MQNKDQKCSLLVNVYDLRIGYLILRRQTAFESISLQELSIQQKKFLL